MHRKTAEEKRKRERERERGKETEKGDLGGISNKITTAVPLAIYRLCSEQCEPVGGVAPRYHNTKRLFVRR